jgi:type I restriction-modification system DNA methylase subunit
MKKYTFVLLLLFILFLSACDETQSQIIDEPDTEITLNMIKDEILGEAIMIDQASKLYCAQTLCDEDQELNWSDLRPYVANFHEDYYELTDDTIISRYDGQYWHITLERVESGEYELIEDSIASECDRTCVIIDTN